MSQSKKTVIVGATPNKNRYAYLAATMLREAGHEIVPIGIRKGAVLDIEIQDIREKPRVEDVHTLTLYINPTNQIQWQQYMLQLAPRRIIFNPGTENPELRAMAADAGIEVVDACTLVLLRTGRY